MVALVATASLGPKCTAGHLVDVFAPCSRLLWRGRMEQPLFGEVHGDEEGRERIPSSPPSVFYCSMVIPWESYFCLYR